MKALVIAPQPFFSPRGTPFSVYYRTLIMAELGVKIDLLTYGEGQDVNIPGVRIIRIPQFKLLGNVKTGPSYLKIILDGVLSLWLVGLLICNRYHFVHAHEEAVFFSRILKPLFGYKLVYDMHSSLPEQLINFNFTKAKGIIKLFKKLEDSCLRSSDAIITICPALFDYVNGLINDKSKHFLIENSIFDRVRLVEASGSSQSTKIDNGLNIDVPQDKPLIVYAGTLEHYQGIDLLLAAFKKVTRVNSDAFLLIVGGTEKQVKHYSEIAMTNVIADRCLFTGRVPHESARQFIKMATILVSPRTAGINTPLKIYEQLASGIPLVATKIYSHTQVLDDNVAFLVEPEVNDMAQGLVSALMSENERYIKVQNAKRLYETKYSRPVYVDKVERLLEVLK